MLIKPPVEWRLYLATDAGMARGRSHREVVEAALRGGVDVVQLRDKTASSRALYETALELRELCHTAGAALIVNDRVDIALAADADGVHVGQQDLPLDSVQRLIKYTASTPSTSSIISERFIIGVSVGSVEEALEAERLGADYVSISPVFTPSIAKTDAGKPLGLDLITQVRQAVKISVTAIGGIDKSNVQSVIRAGADSAAVISVVVAQEDIEAAARELTMLIEAAKRRPTTD